MSFAIPRCVTQATATASRLWLASRIARPRRRKYTAALALTRAVGLRGVTSARRCQAGIHRRRLRARKRWVLALATLASCAQSGFATPRTHAVAVNGTARVACHTLGVEAIAREAHTVVLASGIVGLLFDACPAEGAERTGWARRVAQVAATCLYQRLADTVLADIGGVALVLRDARHSANAGNAATAGGALAAGVTDAARVGFARAASHQRKTEHEPANPVRKE